MIFVFCCTEVHKFPLLFQFYLIQMETQGIMHTKTICLQKETDAQ